LGRDCDEADPPTLESEAQYLPGRELVVDGEAEAVQNRDDHPTTRSTE
jgi:hypothetical protein